MSSVELFTFGPVAWGVDASPFCVKLFTFLRLANIPVKLVTGGKMSPVAGRCPWVKLHRADGTTLVIEDSQRVIKELTVEFDVKMDASLTEQQRVLGEAVTRIAENTIYQCLVRNRWVDHFDTCAREYFIPLPDAVKRFVMKLVRNKSIIPMLNAHGNGDLSDAEYHAVYVDGVKFIAQTLGSNQFLLGTSHPTSYDSVAYGFLSSLIDAPFPSPAKSFAASNSIIAAYVRRIEALAFPDMKTLIESDRERQKKVIAKRNRIFPLVVAGVAAALSGLVYVAWHSVSSYFA